MRRQQRSGTGRARAGREGKGWGWWQRVEAAGGLRRRCVARAPRDSMAAKAPRPVRSVGAGQTAEQGIVGKSCAWLPLTTGVVTPQPIKGQRRGARAATARGFHWRVKPSRIPQQSCHGGRDRQCPKDGFSGIRTAGDCFPHVRCSSRQRLRSRHGEGRTERVAGTSPEAREASGWGVAGHFAWDGV